MSMNKTKVNGTRNRTRVNNSRNKQVNINKCVHRNPRRQFQSQSSISSSSSFLSSNPSPTNAPKRRSGHEAKRYKRRSGTV